MSKQFHIGDVLSITHERLVSPRLIEGVYDILNYMTGDNLFTHQLPRAGRECKEPLLAQHPQLREVDSSGVNGSNWKTWLAEQSAKYGEYLDVTPLKEWTHVDPILEAEAMVGKERVVTVFAPERDAEI